MALPSVQQISPYIASTTQASLAIREGERVFVRVLSALGNNFYRVSFKGAQFSVKSEQPLQEGDHIFARVSLAKAGEVRLITEKTLPRALAMQESIASFFATEGIPLDTLSVTLLQFFQQSGFKIDKAFFKKARALSSSFEGSEKIAGEVALLLQEKGIEPTEEAIKSLIALFKREGGSPDSEKKAENKTKEDNSFIQKIYPAGTSQKEGLLTLINHIPCKKKHWIFLPFEWEHKSVTGCGVMRILLDVSEKKTEKMGLTCKMPSTKYYFMVYYTEGKATRLDFCIEPEAHEKQKATLAERFSAILSKAGLSLSVAYNSASRSEGVCTTDEAVAFVAGKI